jgi:hypothetical protein
LEAAHERVLAYWHPESVQALSAAVREEPHHQTESASELEEQFYAERRAALADVEMEPVFDSLEAIRYDAPADWTPALR